MTDDVTVQDSDDGQRRNDGPVSPQVIHQPSLGRVTAERGIVHSPHGQLIHGKLSTQEHRRILSRGRAADGAVCRS
ncbi:MAG: hypothetical protein ACT4NP_01425 [Pseudonocardiales bacterium]